MTTPAARYIQPMPANAKSQLNPLLKLALEWGR